MSRIILTSRPSMDDRFHEVDTPLPKIRNLILPKEYLNAQGKVVPITDKVTTKERASDLNVIGKILVHKNTTTGAVVTSTVMKQPVLQVIEKQQATMNIHHLYGDQMLAKGRQNYIRTILEARCLTDKEDEGFFHKAHELTTLIDRVHPARKMAVADRLCGILEELVFNKDADFHAIIKKEFPLTPEGDGFIDASFLDAFTKRIIVFHLKTFFINRLSDDKFLLGLPETLQRPDKGHFLLIIKALKWRQRKAFFCNLDRVFKENPNKAHLNPSKELKLLLKIRNKTFVDEYQLQGESSHQLPAKLINFSK